MCTGNICAHHDGRPNNGHRKILAERQLEFQRICILFDIFFIENSESLPTVIMAGCNYISDLKYYALQNVLTKL